MNNSNKSLDRQSVINVIEGRGKAERVPVMYQFWIHEGIWGDREEAVVTMKRDYPCDIQYIQFNMPDELESPEKYPAYRWINTAEAADFKDIAHDARVILKDWTNLDTILEQFPDPSCPHLIPESPEDDGRYRLGHWWYGYFERLWKFRGMTNALMDFYTDPDSVHRVFRKLTDFYMTALSRGRKELKLDGILFSDDIGMQAGPFFSTDLFNEFLYPYYKELADRAHDLGMHLWLHSCGNIEPFIPRLIDLGLDVLHPIQKYTMDEKYIAETYGDRLCLLAGFDVQKIIPFGTPEEVRSEVRFLKKTYSRNEGRFMMTCGNGLTEDTPLESLKALFEESLK